MEFRNKVIIICFALIFFFGFYILEAQDNLVPQFPEWMVKKRVQALNLETPIQLDYNEAVQAYIDVYTVKRREHLAKIISRSISIVRSRNDSIPAFKPNQPPVA